MILIKTIIILEMLIAIVIRFVLLLLFVTGQVVKTDNTLQFYAIHKIISS